MEIMGTTFPGEVVFSIGVVLFILVLWKITSVARVPVRKQSRAESHKHRSTEMYRKKYQGDVKQVEIDDNLPRAVKLILKLLKLLIVNTQKK